MTPSAVNRLENRLREHAVNPILICKIIRVAVAVRDDPHAFCRALRDTQFSARSCKQIIEYLENGR